MKLYRSRHSFVAEQTGRFYTLNASSWDDLVAREDLRDYLEHRIAEGKPADVAAPLDHIRRFILLWV